MRVKSLDYINTPEDELFAAVSACGENLYFVSLANKALATAETEGFRDLDLFVNAMTEESKPKPVMLVHGYLTDEETGNPLFGELSILKNNNHKSKGLLYTNQGDGNFTLILTKGNNYKVNFISTGFYPKEVEFNPADLADCTEETQNIKLKRWEGYYLLNTLNSLNNSPIDADVQVLLSPNNTPVPIERTDKGQHKASIRGGQVYTVRVSGEGLNDTTYTFIPQINDIKRTGFEESITVTVEQPKLNIRDSQQRHTRRNQKLSFVPC